MDTEPWDDGRSDVRRVAVLPLGAHDAVTGVPVVRNRDQRAVSLTAAEWRQVLRYLGDLAPNIAAERAYERAAYVVLDGEPRVEVVEAVAPGRAAPVPANGLRIGRTWAAGSATDTDRAALARGGYRHAYLVDSDTTTPQTLRVERHRTTTDVEQVYRSPRPPGAGVHRTGGPHTPTHPAGVPRPPEGSWLVEWSRLDGFDAVTGGPVVRDHHGPWVRLTGSERWHLLGTLRDAVLPGATVETHFERAGLLVADPGGGAPWLLVVEARAVRTPVCVPDGAVVVARTRIPDDAELVPSGADLEALARGGYPYGDLVGSEFGGAVTAVRFDPAGSTDRTDVMVVHTGEGDAPDGPGEPWRLIASYPLGDHDAATGQPVRRERGPGFVALTEPEQQRLLRHLADIPPSGEDVPRQRAAFVVLPADGGKPRLEIGEAVAAGVDVEVPDGAIVLGRTRVRAAEDMEPSAADLAELTRGGYGRGYLVARGLDGSVHAVGFDREGATAPAMRLLTDGSETADTDAMADTGGLDPDVSGVAAIDPARTSAVPGDPAAARRYAAMPHGAANGGRVVWARDLDRRDFATDTWLPQGRDGSDLTAAEQRAVLDVVLDRLRSADGGEPHGYTVVLADPADGGPPLVAVLEGDGDHVVVPVGQVELAHTHRVRIGAGAAQERRWHPSLPDLLDLERSGLPHRHLILWAEPQVRGRNTAAEVAGVVTYHADGHEEPAPVTAPLAVPRPATRHADAVRRLADLRPGWLWHQDALDALSLAATIGAHDTGGVTADMSAAMRRTASAARDFLLAHSVDDPELLALDTAVGADPAAYLARVRAAGAAAVRAAERTAIRTDPAVRRNAHHATELRHHIERRTDWRADSLIAEMAAHLTAGSHPEYASVFADLLDSTARSGLDLGLTAEAPPADAPSPADVTRKRGFPGRTRGAPAQQPSTESAEQLMDDLRAGLSRHAWSLRTLERAMRGEPLSAEERRFRTAVMAMADSVDASVNGVTATAWRPGWRPPGHLPPKVHERQHRGFQEPAAGAFVVGPRKALPNSDEALRRYRAAAADLPEGGDRVVWATPLTGRDFVQGDPVVRGESGMGLTADESWAVVDTVLDVRRQGGEGSSGHAIVLLDPPDDRGAPLVAVVESAPDRVVAPSGSVVLARTREAEENTWHPTPLDFVELQRGGRPHGTVILVSALRGSRPDTPPVTLAKVTAFFPDGSERPVLPGSPLTFARAEPVEPSAADWIARTESAWWWTALAATRRNVARSARVGGLDEIGYERAERLLAAGRKALDEVGVSSESRPGGSRLGSAGHEFVDIVRSQVNRDAWMRSRLDLLRTTVERALVDNRRKVRVAQPEVRTNALHAMNLLYETDNSLAAEMARQVRAGTHPEYRALLVDMVLSTLRLGSELRMSDENGVEMPHPDLWKSLRKAIDGGSGRAILRWSVEGVLSPGPKPDRVDRAEQEFIDNAGRGAEAVWNLCPDASRASDRWRPEWHPAPDPFLHPPAPTTDPD